MSNLDGMARSRGDGGVVALNPGEFSDVDGGEFALGGDHLGERLATGGAGFIINAAVR